MSEFIPLRAKAKIYKTKIDGETKYFQIFESKSDDMIDVLSWDSELEKSEASTIPNAFLDNFIKRGIFKQCGEGIKAKFMLLDSDKVTTND